MAERTGEHRRTRVVRRISGAAALVVALALAGCAAPIVGGGASGGSTTSTLLGPAPSSTVTTVAPPTTTVAPPTSAPSSSTRDRLAALVVNDRPTPTGTYRREDWPHWADVDGNGCDARQDALIAWSNVPATVNRVGGCRVVTGSWVSPYDGRTTTNPSDFDIDHLVPLEEAFISGGWAWTAGLRRSFANDQRELVAASATSNRSKGSRTPDQWRPADHASWCAYADGWVSIKQRWNLSVTTNERDALGQMLDTCTAAGPVWPGRG